MRILDSKDPRDRPFADSAPTIQLSAEAEDFFGQVRAGLDAAGVAYPSPEWTWDDELAAAQLLDLVHHGLGLGDQAGGTSITSSRCTSTAELRGTTERPRASRWVFVKAAPNSRINEE